MERSTRSAVDLRLPSIISLLLALVSFRSITPGFPLRMASSVLPNSILAKVVEGLYSATV